MKKPAVLHKVRPSHSLSALASAVAAASMLASQPALALLEEVVVTATKREKSQQSIPVSVTAIGAELRTASIRNLRDIEGFAPNVTIDNNGGGPAAATISIRGISYQEVDKSLDPSIGVILDGVYLGTNVGQILTNFDIERIEILRGPQGTLFGKNTIGGVINVVRNKPTGEFGGEVRASTGSWNAQEFMGVVNFPIVQDKLSAKVYGIDSSHDGWLTNTTLKDDTGRVDSTSYGFALLATPTDNFELQFNYDRIEDDSDLVGGQNFNGPESLSCGTFGPLGDLGVPGIWTSEVGCEALDTGSDKDSVSLNDHQSASVETDAFTLRLAWDVGPGIISSITGYRENTEFRRAEYDGSAADFIFLNFDQDYDQFSQELNFTSSFSETIEFVAGLYYWDSEYTQRSETFGLIQPLIFMQPPGASGILKQNQKTESIAAYFQGDWNINDQFTATFGMRYTDEEKDFEAQTTETVLDGVVIVAPELGQADESWTETTPKLGLSYQHDDDMLLFVSYARGFKSGGFFGRNTTVEGFTTSYDPETVDTFEAGIKSEWLDNRLRVNATLYYSDFDDKQEENIVPLPDGSVGTIVLNAATVEMSGVELEVVAALTENLRMRFSYGYLDAEYKDYVGDVNGDGIVTDNTGLELRRAPENTFGFATTYTRTFGDIELLGDVSYRWRDEYETINTNDPAGHVDSFGIWSASVDLVYQENIQLSVYGRNLDDERHPTAAINIGPLSTFGTWNEPRNWGVELRYTF